MGKLKLPLNTKELNWFYSTSCTSYYHIITTSSRLITPELKMLFYLHRAITTDCIDGKL